MVIHLIMKVDANRYIKSKEEKENVLVNLLMCGLIVGVEDLVHFR